MCKIFHILLTLKKSQKLYCVHWAHMIRLYSTISSLQGLSSISFSQRERNVYHTQNEQLKSTWLKHVHNRNINELCCLNMIHFCNFKRPAMSIFFSVGNQTIQLCFLYTHIHIFTYLT